MKSATASALRSPRAFPIRPASPHALATVPAAHPVGSWRYDGLPRRRGLSYTAGLVLSVGLHTALFLGFADAPAPARPVARVEEQVIQIAMPTLPPEEPEVAPAELAEVAPAETIAVPQLMEVPAMVALNDFQQLVDLRPQTDLDVAALRQMTIPANHGRGGSGAAAFGNVFNLADLDRTPQPISQPAPRVPPNAPFGVDEERVVVSFIVDADGNVRQPRVVESSNLGFDRAAVEGVQRWKFRPGLKAGRKVATLMQVPVLFVVSDPV